MSLALASGAGSRYRQTSDVGGANGCRRFGQRPHRPILLRLNLSDALLLVVEPDAHDADHQQQYERRSNDEAGQSGRKRLPVEPALRSRRAGRDCLVNAAQQRCANAQRHRLRGGREGQQPDCFFVGFQLKCAGRTDGDVQPHTLAIIGIERAERVGRDQIPDVTVVSIIHAGQIIMLGIHRPYPHSLC
ncbi:MAG: hypothetical protein M9890_13540 [Thermomicrobiales bacterium]|nr:hypothetical protein [Thermomicrobiales bacterium]